MPTTPINRDSVLQVATDAVVTEDTVPSGEVLKMPSMAAPGVDSKYDTDFPVESSVAGMGSYNHSFGDDSMVTLGYRTASSRMIPVSRPSRLIRGLLVVLILLLALMTLTGAYLAQNITEAVAGIRYDKLETIEVSQLPPLPTAEALLRESVYRQAQIDFPERHLELGRMRIKAFMQRENYAAAANETRELLEWAQIRGQTGHDVLELAKIATATRDHALAHEALNSLSWEKLSPAQATEGKALLGRLKEFQRR